MIQRTLVICILSGVLMLNGCGDESSQKHESSVLATSQTNFTETSLTEDKASSNDAVETTITNQSPVTAQQRETALSILSSAAFPSASQYTIGQLVNSTFSEYTVSVELIDSRKSQAMGYETFKVTIQGQYYKNTAAKSSGSTSYGKTRFTVHVQYLSGNIDYSHCQASPSVEDEDMQNQDVYNAMVFIAFGK